VRRTGSSPREDHQLANREAAACRERSSRSPREEQQLTREEQQHAGREQQLAGRGQQLAEKNNSSPRKEMQLTDLDRQVPRVTYVATRDTY
jgi:hypothetical protein